MASTPIYPENFGAAGNGTTDDTAAINAYIAYVKSLHATSNTTYLTYEFLPNSVYLISGPLNFGFTFSTGNNPTFTILGNGARIIGTTTGDAMLDCINFGYGSKIENLHITGNAGGAQKCAILYGYSQPSASGGFGWSDQFILTGVTVIGSFAYSCIFNRGADSCTASDCEWLAESTTNTGIQINDSGFALIDDGAGAWSMTSAITPLSPLGTNNGTGNKYINCTIQSTHGSPIWHSTGFVHEFISCYSSTNVAAPICVVYLTAGSPGISGLRFDVHCETPAMTNVFYFNAPTGTTSVQFEYWYYEDQACEASTSLFGASSNLTFIRFNYLELLVTFSNSAAKVFDRPTIYQAVGKIVSLMSGSSWNAPAVFSGEFYGQSGSTFTFGSGSVVFYDYVTPGLAIHGSSNVTIQSALKLQTSLDVPKIGATAPGTGVFTTLTTTGAAALANGSTAVTQAAGDNSTKIASTAFVAAAVAAEAARAEAAEAATRTTANAALPNTPAALAALMTSWLSSLPKSSPGPAAIWWNNSGTPTYS